MNKFVKNVVKKDERDYFIKGKKINLLIYDNKIVRFGDLKKWMEKFRY